MASLVTDDFTNPTDKIKELEDELAECKVARDAALAEIERRDTSGHQKASNQEETWADAKDGDWQNQRKTINGITKRWTGRYWVELSTGNDDNMFNMNMRGGRKKRKKSRKKRTRRKRKRRKRRKTKKKRRRRRKR
jgi:hypothetical protein